MCKVREMHTSPSRRGYPLMAQWSCPHLKRLLWQMLVAVSRCFKRYAIFWTKIDADRFPSPQVNVPIFGFVENMAYFQCGRIFLEKMDVRILQSR